MELLNHDNTINIFHFVSRIDKVENILNIFYKRHLQKPENLTILSISNDYYKSILLLLLDASNIEYLNNISDKNIGFFKHDTKAFYYLSLLLEVKTPYVLIADAFDVCINTFDDIIEKFESFNCDMLFNASTGSYPSYVDTSKEFFTLLYEGKSHKFLNSGVCLARTEFAKQFYKEAVEHSSKVKLNNPLSAELYVFRDLIIKNNYTNIKLDVDYKIIACSLLDFSIEGDTVQINTGKGLDIFPKLNTYQLFSSDTSKSIFFDVVLPIAKNSKHIYDLTLEFNNTFYNTINYVELKESPYDLIVALHSLRINIELILNLISSHLLKSDSAIFLTHSYITELFCKELQKNAKIKLLWFPLFIKIQLIEYD